MSVPRAKAGEEVPVPVTNRIRPHVTGIAVGLAAAAWIATRAPEAGVAKLVRGVFLGFGTAVLASHLLHRVDESQDSRRAYRQAKTAWLEAVTRSIASDSGRSGGAGSSEPVGGEAPHWLTAAVESPVHLSETAFDEEPATAAPVESVPSQADPKAAFELAMADGAWLKAFEALQAPSGDSAPFLADPADLVRLRQASMEEIFQRMHSGTVREDVARLAQAVVTAFPDTTEGKTLAQVIGVLRRSAGLCPRCAQPYRGIASACHDCLRGTPESYQIAWDDDQEPAGTPAE